MSQQAEKLAKTARTALADALNALQTSADVPDALMEVADPIAQAMGILHRIERTQGQDMTGKEVALKHVRAALDMLQGFEFSHEALDIVMEKVAGCLTAVHQVARMAAPSAPQAAPPPSPALGAPGPLAGNGAQVPPAPASRPGVAVAPSPPQTIKPSQTIPIGQPSPVAAVPAAAPAAAPAASVAPVSAVPASAVRGPTPMPQAYVPLPIPPPPAPVEAQVTPRGTQMMPAHAPASVTPAPVSRPAAPMQDSTFPLSRPATPATPATPSQPAFASAAAPSVTPSPSVTPQSARQAPSASVQPAPPSQARPSQPRGKSQPEIQGNVVVELGAHSASNFYKGLGGNDVIEHGGLFVATYRIPKLGTSVMLRVLLPGDYEFTAAGTVQWTREPSDGVDAYEPGFGARFSQITPEGRQLVYRYTRNREPMFYDDL